jgi:hypothetical protein
MPMMMRAIDSPLAPFEPRPVTDADISELQS